MKAFARVAIGLCVVAGLAGACSKEQTPPAPLDTRPDPYSDGGEAAPALPDVELPTHEAAPVAQRE